LATVFLVDDRVGRFRVDEEMKVLYLAATNAAQGDAGRLAVAGPDAQMEFRVATRAHDAETFVVSVHGDVDPGTAPELERELLEVVQLGARRVVVDLTETAFFDSSAIHALLRSGEQLQGERPAARRRVRKSQHQEGVRDHRHRSRSSDSRHRRAGGWRYRERSTGKQRQRSIRRTGATAAASRFTFGCWLAA